MIVTHVLLEPCVMRKTDPKWRFALGASPVTEGVVVTLTAENGAQGFGYGSATAHMGATQLSLMAALTRFVPLSDGTRLLCGRRDIAGARRRFYRA